MVEKALRTRSVGRTLVVHAQTESTMDDARALAQEGAASGTVVLAEEQTGGRGTRGRSWVSPPSDNLYFTIVVRPKPEQMARLSMVTPVAVANAVEQVVGLYPRIKWPNDLLLRGKKFAGILIESEWSGSRPQFALVGIGINVNSHPDLAGTEANRPATSLAAERGRSQDREPLLAALLSSFERAYEGATTAALFEGWRSRLVTLGRPVTLQTGDGAPVEGVAEDVREDGSLVVRTSSGELREFQAAEVFS
jgi:BirA family biotin operon repressor/biotin-[acetyl-CoA-carboxylase] ligase